MRETPSSSSSSSSSTPPPSPSSSGKKKTLHFISSSSLLKSVIVAVLISLLVISTTLFFTNTSYPNPSSFVSSSSSSSSSSSPSPSSSSVDDDGGKEGWVPLQPVAAPSPAPIAAPTPRHIYPKLDRIELGLSRARSAIRRSIKESNRTTTLPDKDYVPIGPTYRNAFAFHRSYLEMEKVFRVHVYEEGEPPLFHDGPCRSIYSSEGRFIYNMEVETRLRTRDPDEAHVHFLPFSVTKMVKFLYDRKVHDRRPIRRTVHDYIGLIGRRYPYWNRSLGADHFMLSCHDWGPHATAAIPHLFFNSIRVLCNANTSEGFNPTKDVSLPEINLKTGSITGIIGGPSPSRRPILAFFAGGLHGPVRPSLIEHWKGKDNDVQVYEYLPKGISYYDMMRKSKYCICPSGYEVASPRVVEAIYLECVPVIISDHYVLPFSDVLDWKVFSVHVPVERIPDLKKILMGISSRRYVRMQRRLRTVQRHFVVNTPPVRFDLFHMILHSVWLRRINVRIRPNRL